MKSTGKDPFSTNPVVTENHEQKCAPHKDYRKPNGDSAGCSAMPATQDY